MTGLWKKFRSLNRGAQIGGWIGFGGFLVLGLLKAIYVGGFIGLAVAGRMYGTPVEPSFVPVLLVFVGMVAAILFLATVFVGAGMLIGGGIGWLVTLGARKRVEEPAPVPRPALPPPRAPRPVKVGRTWQLPPKPAWYKLNRDNGYADTGRRVGGYLGLGLFALIGLWPALFYGGALGLGLAGDIFGTPVPETFLPRLMVLIGMILGAAAMAALSTTVGAVVGTFVGYLVSLATQSVVWVGRAIAVRATG